MTMSTHQHKTAVRAARIRLAVIERHAAVAEEQSAADALAAVLKGDASGAPTRAARDAKERIAECAARYIAAHDVAKTCAVFPKVDKGVRRHEVIAEQLKVMREQSGVNVGRFEPSMVFEGEMSIAANRAIDDGVAALIAFFERNGMVPKMPKDTADGE